jgi:hypothetical protein
VVGLRRFKLGRNTVLVIDTPTGTKPVPEGWGFTDWEEKKIWFIENGFNPEDITDEFRVNMFHEEVA